MDINKKEFKGLPNKSLIYRTKRDERLNTKNTMKTYDNAKRLAQMVEQPYRYNLLELYKDVIEDSHLKSVYIQRKSRLTGLPFTIMNENNNKVNEKLTKLFSEPWFFEFLNMTMDAIFFGNSLIELNKIDNNIQLTLIPRENVIPEFQMVKANPQDYTGKIDYSQPIYNNNLIDINHNFNRRNLGELLNLSKLVIIKNETILNWAQMVEIEGQALRVATTDTEDPVQLNSLYNFLANLGRSGYAVKDSQTDIEFIESGGSNSDLFDLLIERINSEISKQILGVTMLNDEGGSRSQSEVHERSSYLITKSDIRFIEFIVNDMLIPKLRKLGVLNTKNVKFKFNEIEILSVDEKLEIDQFLIDNFEVTDINYFEERYGVELNGFKNNDDTLNE